MNLFIPFLTFMIVSLEVSGFQHFVHQIIRKHIKETDYSDRTFEIEDCDESSTKGIAPRPSSTIAASSTKELFSSTMSTKKSKIIHALEVEDYNETLTKLTNTFPSTSKSTTSTNAPISSTMATRNNQDMRPLSSQINRVLLSPFCNTCDGYKDPNHRKLCQRRRC